MWFLFLKISRATNRWKDIGAFYLMPHLMKGPTKWPPEGPTTVPLAHKRNLHGTLEDTGNHREPQ